MEGNEQGAGCGVGLETLSETARHLAGARAIGRILGVGT